MKTETRLDQKEPQGIEQVRESRRVAIVDVPLPDTGIAVYVVYET